MSDNKVANLTAKRGKSPEHPYRIDGDDMPCPVCIKDVPPQDYGWGNVCGLAMVDDLFNWNAVLGEDQKIEVPDFVRDFIEGAVKELAGGRDANELSRRGVAVGMLDGIAALVSFALESSDVRERMRKELAVQTERLEEFQRLEEVRHKTIAFDIHAKAAGREHPVDHSPYMALG